MQSIATAIRKTQFNEKRTLSVPRRQQDTKYVHQFCSLLCSAPICDGYIKPRISLNPLATACGVRNPTTRRTL